MSTGDPSVDYGAGDARGYILFTTVEMPTSEGRSLGDHCVRTDPATTDVRLIPAPENMPASAPKFW